MNLEAFIQCSKELEQHHLEAAKLIARLRKGVIMRHHFGLPMGGAYHIRMQGTVRRVGLSRDKYLGDYVVTDEQGNEVARCRVDELPAELKP